MVLSRLKLQLPLEIRVSGLSFQHQSDKQPSDYQIETIEEAALDISFKNGLPLGVDLVLRTLKKGVITAEIHLRSQQSTLLAPPVLNDMGDVTAPTAQITRISLEQPDLQKLLDADQIIFLGVCATPGQQYSRLRQGMRLDMQVGLYLRATVKTSPNN